jgi:hypothetical protein
MGVAIVGFLGVQAGIAGLTTAAGLTTVGTLLAAGIDIGISLGVSALNQPKSPKPQETKTVINESVPDRWLHFGRRRVGGRIIAIETARDRCHQVLYVGQGEIDGFEEFYLDDRLVRLEDLDADGWVRIPPFGYPAGEGNSRIQIRWRVGTEDQTAFQEMIDAFGAPIWTENHRGRGCALIYISGTSTSAKKSNFMKVYPNRYTKLTTVIRGEKVFDPRTMSWGFSENLVLILARYLTHPKGFKIDPAYINWDNFAAAATHADDLLPTKAGGTARRYWGQFGVNLNVPREDNLSRLLIALGGRLIIMPDGLIGYVAGKWNAPSFSLPNQRQISTGLQNFVEPDREVERVVVRYTNPNARYNEAVSRGYPLDVVSPNKTKYIEAYEVTEHNHAQRIAKREYWRANPEWHGPVSCGLIGLNLWGETTMLASEPDLELVDHAMEINALEVEDDAMEVSLDVASTSEAVWAFDAATEEGDAPVDPQEYGDESTEEPTDVEAHCETRVLQGGQSIAVLVATWSQPEDENEDGGRHLTADAQYSEADQNRWLPMDVDDGDVSAESGAVEDGQLYDVRVRWSLQNGEPSNWVVVENVLAVASVGDFLTSNGGYVTSNGNYVTYTE